MKFVLRDLFDSIKNNIWLYALIIVSQIIGIVCLLSIYGVYVSYEKKQIQTNIDKLDIEVTFDNVTVGELRSSMHKLLGRIENNIDYIYLLTGYGDRMINCHFEYHSGYQIPKSINKRIPIIEGRIFNYEDIDLGKKAIVMGGIYSIGSEFVIDGESFEVVGCSGSEFDNRASWMFIEQCPEQLTTDLIIFMFKELPTYEDYSQIKSFFEGEYYDRAKVEEFEILDEDELISIRTMIFMSVIVGIVIALNTGILYAYLIRKRRKDMAVYSIVGASRTARFKLLVTEFSIVTFCTIFTGILMFIGIFVRFINEIYNNSKNIYEAKSYIVLGGTYYLCIMVITSAVVFIVNSIKIKDMLRRVSHD